jgi:hypothetical protein
MNKRSDTQREPRDHADSDSDADGRILIDELARGLIARGPPVGAEVVAEEEQEPQPPLSSVDSDDDSSVEEAQAPPTPLYSIDSDEDSSAEVTQAPQSPLDNSGQLFLLSHYS